jgi:hypothetical protein
MIAIELHNTTKYSVTILVEGLTTSCSRAITANAFFSTGDKIRMEIGNAVQYSLKIEKNVYVEDDPTKKCTNYPNQKFATYSDCTDKELKDRVASLYPGLKPIWLADDYDGVTTKWSDHASSSDTGGLI